MSPENNEVSETNSTQGLNMRIFRNPLTYLPIPLALFGYYETAQSDITTWIEPAHAPAAVEVWKFFLAGAISASFSHAIAVPFDVVKTRIQVTKTAANVPKPNLLSYAANLVREEGLGVLATGMAPTVTGYFIQGSIKYGLYEQLKPFVQSNLLSAGIALDRIWIFMIAGAIAESIASTTLGPFEATRIRKVANPAYASNSLDCAFRMVREEGVGSLFWGLPALLLKNVPYSAMQLTSFEFISSSIYSNLDSVGILGEEVLRYQLLITGISALCAAVISTLASQPGDTLLSTINKNIRSNIALLATPGSGSSLTANQLPELKAEVEPMVNMSIFTAMNEAWQEIGVKGMFKGLQARLFHVIAIVVVQLLVYDYIKQLCGIPVTGSH